MMGEGQPQCASTPTHHTPSPLTGPYLTVFQLVNQAHLELLLEGELPKIGSSPLRLDGRHFRPLYLFLQLLQTLVLHVNGNA